MDDLDLQALQLIQSGDEQGLVDLMERHRKTLFRFVYRFVYNEADAAELTEAAFLKVYQNASRFRPRAKVRTWMFTIAGNLCRDFLRKQHKLQDHFSLQTSVKGEPWLSMQDQFPGNEPAPDANADSKENLQRIETAIDQLPHKLKLPLVYCILEGHSYDECAEIIRANRKTVETRIYRARKLLQQSVQR